MAEPLKMRQPGKLKCRTCGFDGNPADAKHCMVCDELLSRTVLRLLLNNWLHRQPEKLISGRLKCRTCGFDDNPADAKRCMVCDELLGRIVLRLLKSESLLFISSSFSLRRYPDMATEYREAILRAESTKEGLSLKHEIFRLKFDMVITVLNLEGRKF
jgi:predicted Zn-ribbon and HTH transcriptional regulator